jgi:hypothetical protein
MEGGPGAVFHKTKEQGEVHMIAQLTRRLGALALLVVGAVHLQQFLAADYSAVPTIGPLFLLNAIAAGLVGIALLAPLERWVSDRRAHLAVGLLASAGAAIALGSLVALYISETGTLFGFAEDGYGTPIVIAIVAEVATVLLLAPVAATAVRRASSPRRRHRTGATFPSSP